MAWFGVLGVGFCAACSVTVSGSGNENGATDGGAGLGGDAFSAADSGAVLGGDAGSVVVSPDTNPNLEWAVEARVRQLVNAARQSGATCGTEVYPPVAAVAFDPLLAQAARLHSADMCARQFFDHDNLDGKSPFDRIKALGYKFSTAGENIAAGQVDPESVMQGWMKSPGHCQNIMNANFKELGVGYASCNGKFPHYWTQNFGTKQ